MDLHIGIDLSLDSTGITFRRGDKTTFLAVLNIRKFTNAKGVNPDTILEDNIIANEDSVQVLKTLVSLDDVDIKFIHRPSVPTAKKAGLLDWQRAHIDSSIKLAKQIFDAMMDHIKKYHTATDPMGIKINIENYSYGSVSDNLIQVVELTCLLKNYILTNLIDSDSWYIVAGPTVKKFVGRGDYDKHDLLQAFMRNDVDDKLMVNNPLIKTLKTLDDKCWDIRKKKGKEVKQVKSPIDDIIDSYFMMVYLEEVYLA